MSQTDEVLMRNYRAGDQRALRELFDRYKAKVFGYCLRLLGNRADAEEIAGDVFLALVEHRGSYEPGQPFTRWLFAIAHHRCVSRLRRQRPVFSLWGANPDEPDELRQIQDDGASPSDAAMRHELDSAIRRAIGRLPVEQREAVILCHYQSCSYAEIASILGCSVDKVKVLIYRGRERLRAALAALMKEPSS